MSLINRVVNSFDAAFIFCASIFISFLFGIFVGWSSSTTEKIPYRYGDRVLVRTGHYAGKIGTLTDRLKIDNKIMFSINFEGIVVYGAKVEENDIILVGDWNN